MHILVYQNDRSRNASSDRKMNHIILLVNVQTFQKYNYYYYFLFIGCNHKMWFQLTLTRDRFRTARHKKTHFQSPIFLSILVIF